MNNIINKNRLVTVVVSVLAIGLGIWLFIGPRDPDAVAKSAPQRASHDDPALLAQTKITHEDATKMALARVPNSRVSVTELEAENGKIFWSFDLRAPGVAGVTEVEIDAKTGDFIKFEPPGSE